jgi:hypothetical protein
VDNKKTADQMHDNNADDLLKTDGPSKINGSSCSCTPKSDERQSDAQSRSSLTDNISRFAAIPTIKSTPTSEIRTTTGTLTFANRLDHFLAGVLTGWDIS